MLGVQLLQSAQPCNTLKVIHAAVADVQRRKCGHGGAKISYCAHCATVKYSWLRRVWQSFQEPSQAYLGCLRLMNDDVKRWSARLLG